ncbi:ENTH domain-containing protein [Paramyrothecium foliicola]|nr:ENTH domain-containing protein [Paramyrothecium foliicola]
MPRQPPKAQVSSISIPLLPDQPEPKELTSVPLFHPPLPPVHGPWFAQFEAKLLLHLKPARTDVIASSPTMSSSFEKSVKGATKIKNAPPKTKYIEHLLVATHSGEAGIAEVFRALQHRMRDSTWTVVFKSLITVHLMIREGSPDVTLAFLAKNRNMLAISNFTDAQTQGRNIRHYANYLLERARSYRDTQTDWVRAPESRLEKVTVDKGLLRETESVQRQLSALLMCDVRTRFKQTTDHPETNARKQVLDTAEPETEITITVFRLLVLDLLALFQVLNQGLINILGHFFEMSKPDAERAMDIYRTFARQTDFVVAYLSHARKHEHHTRVEVPKLKHAPVNLGRQLEEYLKDPDFEIHRRQYIAEQEAKKKGGSVAVSKSSFPSVGNDAIPKPAANNPFPSVSNDSQAASKPTATKGPDQDLIDFFDSIEQNQTPMQVAPQQTAMPQQPAVPINNMNSMAFQQMPQQQPTGMIPQPTGFDLNGAFVQQNQSGFMQPQIQQQAPPQQQLQPNFTGAGFGGYTPQQGGFQPGALGSIPQDSMANFQSPSTMSLQPLQTGQPGGLQPQTTNPFRQSMLLSQQTGMSNNSSPTMLSSPATSSPNPNRLSTNPFARSLGQGPAPFGSQPFQQQQQPTGPAAPLQPTPTGTNPFARNASTSPALDQRPQTAGATLVPQPTGSTNPFRQGAFVNHATGMGWQHNQAPIGGGIDQLQTMPVFPRPTQQTPWQQ